MIKTMSDLVVEAKKTGGAALVLISPDNRALYAVKKAMEEEIVTRVFLLGDGAKIKKLPALSDCCQSRYEIIDASDDQSSCQLGINRIKNNDAAMIMKGEINTAVFLKSMLANDSGLPSFRRLSLVCIFEVPGLNRLVILTDPGINPSLFPDGKPESGVDIVGNAIDVARSLGFTKPKIAVLGANEIPSPSVPSSVLARSLSLMPWQNASVSGPLSYDIALYEQYANKKGLSQDPVAGHADILISPDIVSGNVIYKSWIATAGCTVANVVPGVSAPLIISSRSDTDRSKFLTICSSVLFSRYMKENGYDNDRNQDH